jgi:hypothetical protein
MTAGLEAWPAEMTDRHDAALATLTPEQQAAILAGHEQFIAEREQARRDALEAHVARYECCRQASAEARQPVICNQHRQWERISYLLHNIGISHGEAA